MRFRSYLHSAVAILQDYDGNVPFHLFIKKYFSANKKFGSRDRKQITSLCYNYFRLGHAAKNISAEDRILLATFLCDTQPSEFFKSLKPEWNDLIGEPIETKLAMCNTQSAKSYIFPFADDLSKEIDAEKFYKSFLIQPNLFLRIRPGNNKRVTGKLSGVGLTYKLLSENCIALPNSSKIDTVIDLDKDAVVQDYNSQRIGELIQLSIVNCQSPISIWDCCAASGGKSIMTYDINPNIQLTVSDKRETILQNLHKRFAKAGITKYHSFIADLSTGNWQQTTGNYDLIICDAPCTGSGTWARTPEQLFYFNKELIGKYTTLQKKIVRNVIPFIKPGGQLLYVTCSVFKKENEYMVKYIKEECNLQLHDMVLLKGYEIKSDTMFAALFTLKA